MGAGLGEFGRIAAFFAPLAGPGGLGLKDDAALVECPVGRQLVVTVDAIVAGVHFLPDDPPDLVARKLLRVNLSDLAAKGARPRHYLLTTALPASHDDPWVERFAQGLAHDQLLYGVDLLGGDSVMTPGPASFSLTAIGEVAAGAMVRRSGAQPGDHIWVSGTIGDAYLGLKALRGEYAELPEPHRASLVARFRLPEPRVALGPRLVGLAHAMCDVSDGLLADLGHICDTSGVAGVVRLPALPFSAAAQAVLAAQPQLMPALAAGGDDYELLFTAPPEATAQIERLSRELALQLTPVGFIAAGAGVRLVDAAGTEIPVAQAGWQHF
ncbi:MAG: thiamine-phosphate kinase [Thiohalocapsa sp.]